MAVKELMVLGTEFLEPDDLDETEPVGVGVHATLWNTMD